MFPGDVWWLAPLSQRPCILFIIVIIPPVLARETIFEWPTRFRAWRFECLLIRFVLKQIKTVRRRRI